MYYENRVSDFTNFYIFLRVASQSIVIPPSKTSALQQFVPWLLKIAIFNRQIIYFQDINPPSK